MPATLTTRRRLIICAAFGAIALGILAATFLFTPKTDHPDVSGRFKACLLTSADSTDADQVWRGVQASIGAGTVNAQKLVVPKDAASEAGSYFASLIASRCQLIVADGAALSVDLRAVASANPATKFVNAGTPVTLPNVRDIPYPVTDPGIVTREIREAQDAGN